jgi:glycerol-3-phosphate cytidylyltransferase
MRGTVLTYGTFDLFHVGHLNFLRRAKALGERLVVGVSTDTFTAEKGKKTIMRYEERAAIVASIRYVDHVFPETAWQQKLTDVQSHRATTFAIGDDWKGKFDFLQLHCDVVYLPRTEGVSTSDLKRLIADLCAPAPRAPRRRTLRTHTRPASPP